MAKRITKRSKAPTKRRAASADAGAQATKKRTGSVPVRKVYHVLRLIKELGDIEVFLTECEAKKLKIEVCSELAEFARTRLAELAPEEDVDPPGTTRFESVAMARGISVGEPDGCPCLDP